MVAYTDAVAGAHAIELLDGLSCYAREHLSVVIIRLTQPMVGLVCQILDLRHWKENSCKKKRVSLRGQVCINLIVV